MAIKEKRIAGEFAEANFMSRGITVDGRGSVKIDGIFIDAGELPFVMDEVKQAAGECVEDATTHGFKKVIELTSEHGWVPLYMKAPKSIEMFQDIIREKGLKK